MDSYLGNFKGEVVQFDQLQHYGKEKAAFIPTLETSSSSDSDSMELPDPEIYAPEVHTQQIRNNQQTSTPAHNMSPLAGPSMSPLAGPSMSPLAGPSMSSLAGPSMSSLAGPSNLQYTHRKSPTQYFQPQSATPTQQSTSMTPASTPDDSLGARWINLDTPTMSVSRTFLQRSLAARTFISEINLSILKNYYEGGMDSKGKTCEATHKKLPRRLVCLLKV
ncbi:unnamed protein product [Mytilus coruscus]|uniref:Uncharacterized protein n=1 Tax=Mytilus coruscus TaxID=42192 RepID=A0A6J8ABD9_MYTCO|nr:unnamed protein product [Mytilus coruscus]